MDVACNIVFTSGESLTLDGWDEISFLDEVPYIKKTYDGYDLQNDEVVYYEVLNNLTEHKFVGIKRKDPSDEMDFGGKIYAFEQYRNEGKDIEQRNEYLYVQTSAICTIAVNEQWQK
ncbi:hypothetical protein MNZ23_06880 [Staphylococcus equorum]|uniref:hypothetical protein n=1 Tax=Staphylococcus equorum TaxID=246432 RepID=UPI001F597C16|nr:hypothetical protein [Staphylococcus equorum]UNP84976.1 hypothetical protein MNZ23_06880 [Staphylococcus equorum]